MNKKQERRALPSKELRVSSVAADGYTRTFTGMAIVYGVRSQDLGSFVEVIDPSALNRTLAGEPDIFLLSNHDTSKPIARTTAGNMQLINTSRGLKVTAELDTRQSYVNDLAISLERNVVRGMSFGFVCNQDAWRNQNGVLVRTVESLDLLECSIVTNPAYEQTQASVRSCPKELRNLLDSDKHDDEDEDCTCERDEDGNKIDPDCTCDDDDEDEDEEDVRSLQLRIEVAKRRF